MNYKLVFISFFYTAALTFFGASCYNVYMNSPL